LFKIGRIRIHQRKNQHRGTAETGTYKNSHHKSPPYLNSGGLRWSWMNRWRRSSMPARQRKT